MMEINTKYFGRLPYTEEEALLFEDGIYGFEKLKKFLLIRFDDESDSLLSLQSIDDESVSFVVINPFAVYPSYSPRLNAVELKDLGVESEHDLNYYVICVVGETIDESTANFKAPIVVNPENRKAKQLILDNTEYLFKQSFKDFTAKEAKEA